MRLGQKIIKVRVCKKREEKEERSVRMRQTGQGTRDDKMERTGEERSVREQG